MEKNKHIELAFRVVADGVSFFSNGVCGLKKGVVAVQLSPNGIQLVCGNLMPVDLVATGVPEDDEALRTIEQAVHKVRDSLVETRQ